MSTGTQRLQNWIDEHSITPSKLADGLGVSVTAAHRYLKGQRFPEPPVMRRIAEFTNGAVTPNDFYDLHSDKETKPESETPVAGQESSGV